MAPFWGVIFLTRDIHAVQVRESSKSENRLSLVCNLSKRLYEVKALIGSLGFQSTLQESVTCTNGLFVHPLRQSQS